MKNLSELKEERAVQTAWAAEQATEMAEAQSSLVALDKVIAISAAGGGGHDPRRNRSLPGISCEPGQDCNIRLRPDPCAMFSP